MMRGLVVALVVIVLALQTTQVYCGYESVVTFIAKLNATSECYNETVRHPSLFDECELPPYPIEKKDYMKAKKEVPAVGYTKGRLSSECYDVILKTVCVMSLAFCTSERYVVGMFNNDICLHYMQCAVSEFGTSFLQQTCGYLTESYTDQLYNGTDRFIYYVSEKQEREATSDGNPLFNTFIYHCVMTLVLFLRLLA